MQELIVTLDGPAGSGKSTVARRLAQRLGVDFLDTGAMYRGLTALCIDSGFDPGHDPAKVARIVHRVSLEFDWKTDPPRLHARGHGSDRDLTDRLRDADVTAKVSDVAAMSEVRKALVRLQQEIGHSHPRLVTEGRDQGSVVFPGAHAKFYLDARPDVRAKRRADQLRQAGKPADERAILHSIIDRDRKDRTRADGPLICPPDALRIDTSDMTLDEVVEMLERCVRRRCAVALRG